ncbi:MAG: hypothetical protein WA688_04915 [Thermoplasmata archaeon]
MEPPTHRRRDIRGVLLTAVALNLLGAGSLAYLLDTLTSRCNAAFGTVLLYCGASAGAYVGVASVVVACSVLPLVGLWKPRLALVGTVSQGVLTFISFWAIINWGFFPLVFSAIGGLVGLAGSGMAFGRGFPRPPVTTMLFGASWSGMVAFWMVYLVTNPTLLPVYYSPGPAFNGTGCLATFADCVPATQLAVLALGLATEIAIVPLYAPRYWMFGVVGSLGVVASTILAPPYFEFLWIPAIIAGVALLIGTAGCREFWKTGRSMAQALDGAPSRVKGATPVGGRGPPL